MLAFAVAAASLSYALIAAKPALFALAALALIAFVTIECRSTAPMLDLRLLARRYVATILFGVLATAAVFAELIYASLWLQSTAASADLRWLRPDADGGRAVRVIDVHRQTPDHAARPADPASRCVARGRWAAR